MEGKGNIQEGKTTLNISFPEELIGNQNQNFSEKKFHIDLHLS
ncbi:hypothetical protein [Okeania sp.]|nr:hypothetical protein [Okeania sp.]MEB3342359.1 hypothetical protein [Okeania sp.]